MEEEEEEEGNVGGSERMFVGILELSSGKGSKSYSSMDIDLLSVFSIALRSYH